MSKSIVTILLQILMLPSAALFLDDCTSDKSTDLRKDGDGRILEIIRSHRESKR